MYKKPQYVFIAALLVALAGFFPTYFSRLGDAPLRHHIHGGFATAWLLLLIAQGSLASGKRFEWHRRLGRFSPAIALGVVVSATWVQRLVVEVDLEKDLALYSKLYFLDWVLIAFFVAMYIAALANRRNVAIHQRCIMLTLLPLMPPALGRALAFYTLFPLGFEFADMFHPMMLTTTLLLVLAVVDDRRRGEVSWPYPTALGIFALAYLVSLAAPESETILAFLRWTAA